MNYAMEKTHENKIAIFKGKQIRRIIHNNEWWFSIIDVIEVLSGSNRPRKDWADLKKKTIETGTKLAFANQNGTIDKKRKSHFFILKCNHCNFETKYSARQLHFDDIDFDENKFTAPSLT